MGGRVLSSRKNHLFISPQGLKVNSHYLFSPQGLMVYSQGLSKAMPLVKMENFWRTPPGVLDL